MRICFGDKIHVITLAFMLGCNIKPKTLGFSPDYTYKTSGINPQNLIRILSPSINARVTR